MTSFCSSDPTEIYELSLVCCENEKPEGGRDGGTLMK